MKRGVFVKLTSLVVSGILLMESISLKDIYANEEVINGKGFDLSIEETVGEGQKIIELDWEPVDIHGNGPEKTKYFIVRKNVATDEWDLDTGKWELRGDYSTDVVNVLNVYPENKPGSDGFQDWMNQLNDAREDVNIQVDKVDHLDFNANYDSILTVGADGKYNYDIVVFGFWDSFGSGMYNDILPEPADYLREYMNQGYGVLFGHDTVNVKGIHNEFNNLLADYMNITYMPTSYDANNDGKKTDRESWVYSNKVVIDRQTSATTYPFNVNGYDLIIPMSHTLGQITTNEEDIMISFVKNFYEDNGDGPYFHYKVGGKPYVPKESEMIYYHGEEPGFPEGWYRSDAYLLQENNVGYIQAGHTNGETSVAEQLILGNLMYGMNVITYDVDGTDQALDTVRPEKPTYGKVDDDLSFNMVDEGVDYIYRIIAMPIGYNLRGNLEGIVTALDDFDTETYDNGKVNFSIPVNVSVAGSQKEYYYLVNDKPTMSKNHEVYDNENTIKIGIDDSIKVSEIDADPTTPIKDEITPDTYLHIVAADKANNKSDITSINLATITQSTVKFVDQDGEEIKEPTINNGAVIGKDFTPAIDIIDGYEYLESQPARTINLGADPTNNVITHIYNEEHNKQVIGVEHRKYPESINTQQIDTITGIHDTTNTYTIPTYENVNFMGYYTIGDIEGQRVDVSNSSVDIKFEDKETIYLHYEAVEKEAIVEIQDSKTDDVLASISKFGHIGSMINFDKRDVESTGLTNLDCYENASEINNNILTIQLSAIDSENKKIIDLIPREKEIIYRGYDLTHVETTVEDNDKTTESAVEIREVIEDYEIKSQKSYGDFEELGREYYTYSSQSGEKTIDVNIKDIEGWTKVSTEPAIQLDFADTSKIRYINYYKGNLPTEEYSYKTYSYDILSSELISESTQEYKNVIEAPNVSIAPINEYNNTIAGRLVDYKPVSVTIINPNGVSSKYDADVNVNGLLPEIDENGDYIVGNYDIEIDYAPMIILDYQEIVLDEDGNETIEDFHFEALYEVGKEYEYKPTESMDYYKIKEFNLDGNIIDINNYDFMLDNDDYNIELKVTYEPLAYTITVNNYLVYEKEVIDNLVADSKRLFKEESIFDIKEYPLYEFVDYRVIGGNDTDYKVTVINDMYTEQPKLVKFEAFEEGDYTLNLNYKTKAIVNESFIDTDRRTIRQEETIQSFIGDEVTIIYPNDIKDRYELISVEYEGISYKPYELQDKFNVTIENDSLTFQVKNYETNIIFVFEEKVIEGGDIDEKPIINVGKGKEEQEREEQEKLEEIEQEKEKQDRLFKRLYAPYIEGYTDETIKPDAPIKRSEIMMIIYNLYGNDMEQNQSRLDSFSDVERNQWYSNAVAYSINNEIIHGYNGEIRPNDSITREEVAVILSSFYPDKDIVEAPFIDVEESWSKYYIDKLYSYGIVSGYGDNTYRPNQTATRAEFVSLVNRLIDRPDGFLMERTYPDLTEEHWAYEEMMNAANGGLLYK